MDLHLVIWALLLGLVTTFAPILATRGEAAPARQPAAGVSVGDLAAGLRAAGLTLLDWTYRDPALGQHGGPGMAYVGLIVRNDTELSLQHVRLQIVGVFANGNRVTGEQEDVLPVTIAPGGRGVVVARTLAGNQSSAWADNVKTSRWVGLSVEVEPNAKSNLQDLGFDGLEVDAQGQLTAQLRNTGPLPGPPPAGSNWGGALLACEDEAGRLGAIYLPREVEVPRLEVGDAHTFSFPVSPQDCLTPLIAAGLYAAQ